MGCCSSIPKDELDKKENAQYFQSQEDLKKQKIEDKYSIITPSQVINGVDVYENNIQEILDVLDNVKLCPKCKKILSDNEVNEINNLLDKIECIKSTDKDLKELKRSYYFNVGNYALFGNTDSLEQEEKIKKLIDEKVTHFNECLNIDKIITCPNKNCKYKMRFIWNVNRPPITNPFTDPFLYSDSESDI